MLADHVTLVIAHFGPVELTQTALAAVRRGSVVPAQVTIVDNGPQPFEWHAGDVPFELRVLRPQTNVGFAAAVNLAVQNIDREQGVVWVLNNDTEAEPAALEQLLIAHENLPRSIMSSLILGPDATPWFQRAVFLPWRLEGRHYQHPWPELGGSAAGGIRVAPPRVGPLAIHYVPFCSVLIPLALFRSVGSLDESYFVYAEDVDYCARAQLAGWRVAVATRSVVRHRISASSDAPTRAYLMAYTAALLVRRRYPWLLPCAFLGATAAGVKRVVERRGGRQLTERSRARARAYLDAVFCRPWRDRQ